MIADIGCGLEELFIFSRKNPKVFIDGYEIDKKIYSKVNNIFYKKRKKKFIIKNVLRGSIKKNYDLYF